MTHMFERIILFALGLAFGAVMISDARPGRGFWLAIILVMLAWNLIQYRARGKAASNSGTSLT